MVEGRYGKPLRVEGNESQGTVCTHNFQRFHVVVTFLNGQSQSELCIAGATISAFAPIENLKLQLMNVRENYSWEMRNGMFVLVDAQRRGKPIAIAVRFPTRRTYGASIFALPSSLKVWGHPKVKAPTGQKQS